MTRPHDHSDDPTDSETSTNLVAYFARGGDTHPDGDIYRAALIGRIPEPRHPYPERTIADVDASLDNARTRKLIAGQHAQQPIMDSIDRLLDQRLVLAVKEIVVGP